MTDDAPLSQLFPDIDAEGLAQATLLSEQLSNEGLSLSPDDILVASALSRFGTEVLAQGKKKWPKHVEQLFDAHDPRSTRALAALGQVLQKIRQDGEVERKDRPIIVDGVALMQVLIPLLMLLTPTRAKFGRVPK